MDLTTGDVSVEVRGYQGARGGSGMETVKKLVFFLTSRRLGFQRSASEAKQ